MGQTDLNQNWLVPARLERWQRECLGVLKAKVPRNPNLVWVLSSGTQGVDRLKAIGLTREALRVSAEAVNAHLIAGPRDSWLLALPEYHIGGHSIIVRANLSGAKVIHLTEWQPRKFVETIKCHSVALTSLVPTQVFDLVSLKLKSPRTLRAVVVGGGGLDPNLYLKARALGWPLLPSYGLTECGSQVATASLASLEKSEFPGLQVLPHTRVDFRNQRIFIQSLSLCQFIAEARTSGEFTLEAPLKKGWYRTEDMGDWKRGWLNRRTEQIEIWGRADDVVKVLGVLVSIPQVESEFRKLGEKNKWNCDFTIVPVPDERKGSALVLVTEKSKNKNQLDEWIQFYNTQVQGPYRLSHHVSVDKIPRAGLGKVKKNNLKERLQALRGVKKELSSS